MKINQVPVITYKSKESPGYCAVVLLPVPREYFHGKGGGYGDYGSECRPLGGYGRTREEAMQSLQAAIAEALGSLSEAECTTIDVSVP